ncbi:MAG: type IV toxin-antitoxin system AbiEi family antitoxin domain-containing protein, partial [Deltaproteobacteria bacterium]|nr:type IV toxin-antitoxin system AbiEi family antitoxin domain-containing protein [Deltaproteobacteria bacterium]
MKKRQSTHKINRKLFLMADTQMGYFTAKQAVKAGIPDSNHGYYVNAGQWEKEMRGIYRLTNYPISDQEELMIWYLWSQGRDGTPKGTLSH